MRSYTANSNASYAQDFKYEIFVVSLNTQSVFTKRFTFTGSLQPLFHKLNTLRNLIQSSFYCYHRLDYNLRKRSTLQSSFVSKERIIPHCLNNNIHSITAVAPMINITEVVVLLCLMFIDLVVIIICQTDLNMYINYYDYHCRWKYCLVLSHKLRTLTQITTCL